MRSVFGYALSVVLSAVAMALGLINDKTMITTIGAISLLLNAVLLILSFKTPTKSEISITASAILLIISAIVVYYMDYPGEARNIWAYEVAMVTWIAVFPLAIVLLRTIAICFGSKFNWTLIGGFLAFFGLAIYVFGWIVVASVDGALIDAGEIKLVDAVEGMMAVLFLSAVGGFVMSRIAKRKHIVISRENCEVKE